MSTVTASPPSQPASIDTSRPGVPFFRLFRVELRKAFDTRAGFWFSLSILILCAVVMIVQTFLFNEGFQDFADYSLSMGATLGTFLPIIPILMVTQEWSQRTGLVTFTLEPRRSRTVWAKFSAGFVIAMGVMVLSLAIAVLGTLLAGTVRGVDVSWDYPWSGLQSFFAATVFGVLIGFAIAMLLKNTAAAIVGYFVYSLVLPTIVGFVSFAVDWFEEIAPWIEFNTAQTPLFTGDFKPEGEEWGQLATSGVIWMVLPLAFGVWRLLRSEVK